jgi:hypothetical protein
MLIGLQFTERLYEPWEDVLMARDIRRAALPATGTTRKGLGLLGSCASA